jgi:FkbM family methyltransferase
MPWIQYTRNFEDVILCRALQGIEHGCFLDVGASNPIADNNTCALYQRGWRGIAVEPLAELAAAWAQVRPEDLLIEAAVGATAGETELYVMLDVSQLSTTHSGYAERWRGAGYQVVPRRLPVTTLNAILDEHLGVRALHLLSIDVEGAEPEALSGLDLSRYRPWVMVIEATEPGTPTPAHTEWESSILAAGYELVYLDGVNRFYLASEHPELAHHFGLPPNVWDNFVSYREVELERALATELSGKGQNNSGRENQSGY